MKLLPSGILAMAALLWALPTVHGAEPLPAPAADGGTLSPIELVDAGPPLHEARLFAKKKGKRRRTGRLRPTRAWAVIALGAGTASAIGGAFLGGFAIRASNVLEEELADGEIEYRRFVRLTRSGSTMAVAAYTLYAGSAALTGAGIALLLRDSRERSGKVRVSFGPGGVALSGSF